MRRWRRRSLCALLASAIALGLSACGAGDGASPAATPTPVAGGTFTFPLSAEPVSIEPLNAQDTAGLQVAHQVFQGLVRWVLDDGEMTVQPGIAASWETTDSQTWVFHLRQGVTFQAPVSRPVTAQDLVDSWTRVTDPANQSYVSYILAPLAGCDDRGYQVDPDAGLTGVRALDALTLEVKLRYPFADFLTALGHPVAAVTPVDYIEQVGQQAFARMPVGTGPYMVAAWRAGESLRLVKNPSYWDAAGAGHLDAVDLPVIPDLTEMWLAFQRGELDCASVPPADIAAAESDARVATGEWAAAWWPRLAVYYVGINMRDATLGASPALRQSLAMSADIRSVTSTVSGAVPAVASGYVPEGVPGYRSGQDPYAYDPDAARALVQGLGAVPRLTYWYGASDYGRRVAEALQAGWRDAGLDVAVRELEGPTLLDKLLTADPDDEVQLFGVGYIADFPAMDDFLYPLFQSDQSGVGSYTGYANLQVDEILLEARETEDAQQRENLYAQAEKLILADMPAIPLTGYRDFVVTDGRVAGFVQDPMGLVDLWSVWVE